MFPQQWYLRNAGVVEGRFAEDLNSTGAWADGYFGSGVVVAIVDNGVDFSHDQLEAGYQPQWSYDYVDDDAFPGPKDPSGSGGGTLSGEASNHGTAVAGLILADHDAFGMAGLAPMADWAAIRFIGRGLDALTTAAALTHQFQHIDIYNNSWSPTGRNDFGQLHFVPVPEAVAGALDTATAQGRGGLGSIFVFSAGNAILPEWSSYDGYNNRRDTIVVGAVNPFGILENESEPGANVLICAPGRSGKQGLVTTDLEGGAGNNAAPSPQGDTFVDFFGTSPATALVSGAIALMLEANPGLSWRDVQHILVRSGTRNDITGQGGLWQQNGAGYWVNPRYGFGRLDVTAAVRLAERWSPVGPAQAVEATGGGAGTIPLDSTPLERSDDLDEAQALTLSTAGSPALRLEHVEVDLKLDHPNWGALRVWLESPAGTRVELMDTHAHAADNPDRWTFLSVHHWGEASQGTWTLRVLDKQSGTEGEVEDWTLRLYGTPVQAGDNARPRLGRNLLVLDHYRLTFDPLIDVSDPDAGDALVPLAYFLPANGHLLANPDGSKTYTQHTAAKNDRMGIHVFDGRDGAGQTLLEFTNRGLYALPDQAATRQDQSVWIDVLDNDSPDRELVLALGRAPASGQAVLEADGIRYTPAAGFTGWDRFSYTIDGIATRLGPNQEDEAQRREAWVSVQVIGGTDFYLAFNGEDDHLAAEASPAFNLQDRFTLTAWIRPEGWGEFRFGNVDVGFGRILDKHSVRLLLNGFQTGVVDPDYQNETLVAVFAQQNVTETANFGGPAQAIRLGVWQHVALTLDLQAAEPVQLYVDGVALPLDVTGAPLNGPLEDNTGRPLYVGERAELDRAFEGDIQGLRIWERVLTPAEVADLAAEAGAVSTDALLADWRFAPDAQQRVVPVAGALPLALAVQGPNAATEAVAWQPILDAFPGIWEDADGWWHDPTLGWMRADAFPQIGHHWLGEVVFIERGSTSSILFHPRLKWIEVTDGAFPVIYSLDRERWMIAYPVVTDLQWIYELGEGGAVNSQLYDLGALGLPEPDAFR